jgi:hypothetical protein
MVDVVVVVVSVLLLQPSPPPSSSSLLLLLLQQLRETWRMVDSNRCRMKNCGMLFRSDDDDDDVSFTSIELDMDDVFSTAVTTVD